jgi:hypothetical protein
VCDDVTTTIDSYVELPPIPRAAGSVLGCSPRSFANDLQTGAVNDQVDRSTTLRRFEGEVERLCSSRQCAVIRYGQVIKTQHAQQGSDKFFGLPKW